MSITRRYIRRLRALYTETHKELCADTARKLKRLSRTPAYRYKRLVFTVYPFGLLLQSHSASGVAYLPTGLHLQICDPWHTLQGVGVGDYAVTTWRHTVIVAENGVVNVYTTKKDTPREYR